MEYIQSQLCPLVSQRQPSVLHGGGELRQHREAAQGLLGDEGFGLGLGLDMMDLVGIHGSCALVLAQLDDEGAEVPVKQLHPLQRLGPKVQLALLEQEVLLVLVTAGRTRVSWAALQRCLLGFLI